MTKDLLIACLGCSESMGEKWAQALSSAMDCFSIDTPLRQSAFLAQVGHESGLLTVLEENLRYSEAGLLKTFPKYFTPAQAAVAGKHPELIANRVYASRMGNGDADSGDGWRFRGRGLIQLTGRSNYQACGKNLGLDLLNKPDLLLEARPASMSAGWFWDSRGLNAFADSGNFEKTTRSINGGLIGQEERLELYAKAKDALEV